MDLLTLAAKITLDDSSYKQGVSNAEKMGEQLAGKMSAMTVAAGNIAADMVKKAVSSITGVVKGAIQGYADYQQLIGGVETLFKQSSGKVAKYAKESFRTTGLSANDYMETVTSFSASLLQGLRGNTEAAADVANMAVVDMADNANKMGSDISTIQNAYMGFAKQNYTMLDNLKLGYGGTASEMIRLVNDSKILGRQIDSLDGITFDQLVRAIHTIQSEMGITGTTAEEAAETISGSKASLEAAWTDFLTSIGGEQDKAKLKEASDNFKSTFETYIKTNLAPTLSTTMKNTPELVNAITEAITALPSQAVTDLISSGVDILTSVVEGGTDLVGWLIDGLVNLFDPKKADQGKISELGNAVGTFIGSALSDIVSGAPTVISGLFTAGVSLASSLIEGLFSGLLGVDENDEILKAFGGVTDGMNESITKAVESSTKAGGITEYLKNLVEQYGDAATNTEEWKKAVKDLNDVLPGAGDIIKKYGADVNVALEKVTEFNKQTKELAIAQAKQRALKSKEDIMVEAQGKVWEAETNMSVAKSSIREAQKGLEELFKGKIIDSVTKEAVNTSFEGMTAEQAKEQAERWLTEATGGEGNQAYNEMEPLVKGYLKTITEQEQAYETASSTIKELNDQLVIAKTDYLVAASALEELTGAVGSASKALTMLTHPETTMNSGAYYNWYYGGGGRPGFATGIDWVPEDNLRATLHRGEAVLTKQEADEYRNGGGNAALIGELQALRNDMRNLKLVVGEKTFGRAVVDYSGRRVDGYIGGTESRRAAGFGA